ncbi:hypothetical protein GCM10023339_66880 [Alloalcanivorax gelatiniphagus]
MQYDRTIRPHGQGMFIAGDRDTGVGGGWLAIVTHYGFSLLLSAHPHEPSGGAAPKNGEQRPREFQAASIAVTLWDTVAGHGDHG